MSSSKPDEGKHRPNWLTLSVVGVLASVAIYVYTIGAEIGSMKQQVSNQEFRISALETHGSGPVQANAAKVDAVGARADRILTELLSMQQRLTELAITQQRHGTVLDHLQQELNAQSRKPKED
jgi:cell division protein FtsL